MLDALRSVIGSPAAGYEWMEYIVCAVVLMLVVKIVIDVFFSIFKAVTNFGS